MPHPNIPAEKLTKLGELFLHHGNHADFNDGHCAMEVVSWLADEGFTDAPECASPVIRRYVIALNDRWDDERRQLLKPYLVRMIGTGGDGLDSVRERIAARHVAGLVVPWFRLAGMWAARDVAWRLRSERMDEVRAKVRQRLKDRPVAVADAVAAAAAVAVAAAAADADAAAVAAAAAAADGHNTYSAAYAAARAYYRDNPLPIVQEAAELSAAQQGAALDLLDKLIDAREEGES